MSEPPRPPPEAKALAKRALFERLDGKLTAAGYAVPAPMPPPPPAPALSFEDWAELSVRVVGTSPQDLAAALSARSLTPEVWERLEHDYLNALSADMRAGKRERPAFYDAKLREETARRAGVAAEGTPPAPPTPVLAPGAGTAASPELAAPVWEAMGRMPFVLPAPEAPAKGKRPAKTEPSRAVPAGGETMALDDAAQQRPTPTLPFVGSDAGPGYVPTLFAWQYVTLCTNLTLRPKQRTETLRLYGVPTEAALRAVEERWRHPARRAELAEAMAALGAMIWGRALGGAG